MIFLLAVNYVKGGKVVEIKERHLAKIFADWDSVFPKGVEDPTKDAEELPPALWISIMMIMLNPLFYVISDNVWPSVGGILLMVMNIMIVVFMILIVRNERKRGTNQ